MSMFHRDAPTGDIHKLHQWSYADATAKAAATGFVSSDVGKVALQIDTSAYYILTNYSPITWQLVGSTTASSTDTFTNKTFDAAGTGNSLSNVANANVKAAAAIALNKLAATTANRAIASDASGFLTPSATTDTQLGYLSTTTSDVQAQLNARIANALLTTTGDTIYASSASTPARLPVGSSGQVMKVVGGIPAWSTFSGGINYASSNPDGEANTTGYAAYKDTAGTAPLTGTGGAPTVTITRTTTTPLRGTGSLLITKDAANRQGEGVSFAFTIDSADKAKIVQVTFDYEIPSGTYATGDISMYIVDVTNSTVIQCAGYQVQNISGLPGKHIATFQSASNSTSYRLCWHVASTSASAYTLKFDNLYVGPQIVEYGAPVTDWVSYTPTITGFGTPTNVVARSRRVGGNLEAYISFASGTPTAVAAQFTLGYAGGNANVTIDTSQLSTSNNNVIGYVGMGFNSASSTVPFATTSNQNYFQLGNQGSGSNGLTAINASSLAAAGNVLSIHVEVPIVGWSSSLVCSNDTDTRVVCASYRTLSSTTVTSGTAIKHTTKLVDTHGAYDTSTGIYTVKVPGVYEIAMSGSFAATANDLRLFANGSAVEYFSNLGPSRAGGSIKYSANAGDQLSIVPNASNPASDTVGVVSFTRLSGPSAIAASEKVYASYYQNSSQSITAATQTVVNFDTKIEDSHTAVTTGSGWKFTAPRADKYRLSVVVTSGNNAWTSTQSLAAAFFKSGSAYTGAPQLTAVAQASATFRLMVSGSYTFSLLAGDYLDIRVTQSVTAALFNGAGVFISIESI